MKKIIKIISFLILIFCSSTTFIHATEPQGNNTFYQNIEVLENKLKESAIEYKKNQTFNLNGQNRAYEKLELDFQQLEDYKNLHKDIYLEEQVTSIDSIVSAVTDLEILDSYVSNIQKVTMKEQEEKTNYF